MLRIPRPSVHDWLALLACALPLGDAAAQGQALPGDVLVCLSDADNCAIRHVRDDGTFVRWCTALVPACSGAALTPSGNYATAAWLPSRLLVFDATGAPLSSTPLPQIPGNPGDVAVFADGTLAVANQGGSVETYDETGAHRGSFTAPGMGLPYGLHVDASDTLWACDVDGTPALFAWNRQGALIRSIPLGFAPGDLVRDPDGSLWVTDRAARDVVHLAADGAPIGSFHTIAQGSFDSLGQHPDGTLYLNGTFDESVLHYDTQGSFLGGFALESFSWPTFLTVVGAPPPAVGYCFGDGALQPCPCGNPGGSTEGCAHSGGFGARLISLGSASVAEDDLVARALQLPPNQPVLLFAGTNALNGGAGVLFGDGLRCAGGAVVRLGVAQADALGEAQWGPALLAGTGWSASDTRYLQAWYRDPVHSPCSSAFNLTNGLELALQP